MEIQIMYRQGISIKEISRQTGYSINTVRKYVYVVEPPVYKKREPGPSKLDAYKLYLQNRVKEASPLWIPATVLYQEILSQGYAGKISLLRHYLRSLKPEIKETPIVRFETPAGFQMQVDWAEFRRGGQRLCAFIATLGYSRMSYVEFVENEKLETLLRCHENAFLYFGGVPKQILYDNMRTVIVERDAYGHGKHRLQSGFWDFAKHYGFLPKVCRPYRPQTKGKVERFIHYLKHSFYYPLLTRVQSNNLFLDIDTANIEVMKWLDSVANIRIHATTKQRPNDLFKEEQQQLITIAPPYNESSPPSNIKRYANHVSLTMEKSNTALQHPLSVYEQLIPKEHYHELTA